MVESDRSSLESSAKNCADDDLLRFGISLLPALPTIRFSPRGERCYGLVLRQCLPTESAPVKPNATTQTAITEHASLMAEAARAFRFIRGGGEGIRTPGTVARTAIFKTAAFDRSATPPSVFASTDDARRSPRG